MPGFDWGSVTAGQAKSTPVSEPTPKPRFKITERHRPTWYDAKPVPVVTETDDLAAAIYALLDANEGTAKVTITVRRVG